MHISSYVTLSEDKNLQTYEPQTKLKTSGCISATTAVKLLTSHKQSILVLLVKLLFHTQTVTFFQIESAHYSLVVLFPSLVKGLTAPPLAAARMPYFFCAE